MTKSGNDHDQPRAYRVLIVEDDILSALMMKHLITDSGYHVVGMVGKLPSAMDAAANVEMDAAVLDVNLDGKASYPVADALRRRSIPFVFMTGYMASSLKAGYQQEPILQKPVSERELVQTLKKLTDEDTS